LDERLWLLAEKAWPAPDRTKTSLPGAGYAHFEGFLHDINPLKEAKRFWRIFSLVRLYWKSP
jgi:hypothetical protein